MASFSVSRVTKLFLNPLCWSCFKNKQKQKYSPIHENTNQHNKEHDKQPNSTIYILHISAKRILTFIPRHSIWTSNPVHVLAKKLPTNENTCIYIILYKYVYIYNLSMYIYIFFIIHKFTCIHTHIYIYIHHIYVPTMFPRLSKDAEVKTAFLRPLGGQGPSPTGHGRSRGHPMMGWWYLPFQYGTLIVIQW